MLGPLGIVVHALAASSTGNAKRIFNESDIARLTAEDPAAGPPAANPLDIPSHTDSRFSIRHSNTKMQTGVPVQVQLELDPVGYMPWVPRVPLLLADNNRGCNKGRSKDMGRNILAKTALQRKNRS